MQRFVVRSLANIVLSHADEQKKLWIHSSNLCLFAEESSEMHEQWYATNVDKSCGPLQFQTSCAVMYLCRDFSFSHFSTVSELGKQTVVSLLFALLSIEMSSDLTNMYMTLFSEDHIHKYFSLSLPNAFLRFNALLLCSG